MEEEIIRRTVGVIVKEVILTTLKTLALPAAIGFGVYHVSQMMLRPITKPNKES